jgi:RHS repeat-associated protein
MKINKLLLTCCFTAIAWCSFYKSSFAQTYTLSPSGSICGNSTYITMSGSQPGVAYQLETSTSTGTILIGSAVPGTGYPLNWSNVAVPSGNEYVVMAGGNFVTSTYLTPTTPLTGTATTTGSPIIFPGGSVTFTAHVTTGTGGPNVTYQWFENGSPISGTAAQQQSYAATSPGTYSVLMSSNCGSTMALCPAVIAAGGNILADDCPSLNTVPTATANYVATSIFRQSGIIATTPAQIAAMGACNVNQSIQYFDDIGRPMQTVQVKASANATNDIISPMYYDSYGREAMKYLPYTDGTTAPGSYRPNALLANTGQAAYYGTPGVGITQSTAPYAQTNYEPSPLNRVIEQGDMGSDWQPSTGHTVKINYAVNAANDVQQYEVEPGTTPGQEYISTLSNLGYYNAGDLYLTITEDENWVSGNGQTGTVAQYKDKDGRVILKRIYNTGAIPVSTYYVYDYRGNLSYVLPSGVNPDNGSVSTPMLNNFCYQYRYDGRGRLIEKKLPGKGWEYIVYNIHDQVVLNQDANLQGKSEWLFTKYDQYGRSVIAGISSNTNTRPAQQTVVNTETIFNETQNNSAATGYTDLTYPTAVPSYYLTINYYDNYTWPGASRLLAQNSYQSVLYNKVTGGRVYTVDGVSSYLVANYYDIEGRTIESYSQNCMNGLDHLISTYDFTSDLLKSVRTHTGNNQSTTITVNYIYDHVGRKRQTLEQINTGTNVLLSQIDYNDIGQQYIKHLHSTNNGATFLQDITYSYNERGWLAAANGGTNALFNFQLKYDKPDVGITPQYNGNISEMLYYDAYTTLNKTNSYTYDPLNRLTNAQTTSNALNEHIGYDNMGNISSLVRGGALSANLSYNYTDVNGNLSDQLFSLKNNNVAYRTYSYDVNGNANSNGSNYGIAYNILNLPQTVTNTSGNTTVATYIYDAAGQKLKNTGSDGTWAYAKGVVYGNYTTTSSLSFIQTDEGRIFRNPNGTFDYQYDLKDHLGNVRVSFDAGTSGNAQIIQEDDYYPFGLRNSGGYDYSSNNHFLYNGKEIQTDLANQYDYGARFYDPVIARWNTIDLLAEKDRRWSPYNYAADNSVINIDPDGMDELSVHLDKFGTVLLNNPNDGDNHVYEHDDATTTADIMKTYSPTNTSAGGKDIGELGGTIDVNNIMKNLLKRDGKIAEGLTHNQWINKVLPAWFPVGGPHPWDLKGNMTTIFGVAWSYDQTIKATAAGKVADNDTFFIFRGFSELTENGTVKFTAADIGNYHAGYTGIAAGMPQRAQYNLAGTGELGSGNFFRRLNEMIWNISPNGDRPIDFRWNTQGMVDAAKAGLHP